MAVEDLLSLLQAVILLVAFLPLDFGDEAQWLHALHSGPWLLQPELLLCNNLRFVVALTLDLLPELLELLSREGIEVLIDLLEDSVSTLVHHVLLEGSLGKLLLILTPGDLIDAAIATRSSLQVEAVLQHWLKLVEFTLSRRGV